MAGAAAHQRAHAGQHFLHVEGLGDIVVGAGIEARHLVAPAVARGEDQHRHLAPGPAPFLEDADAVEHRQAEIEHHRVIGFGVAEEVALLAVRGLVDDIARIGEGGHQLPVQIGIVFNDKHAHLFPFQCGT